MFVRGTSGNLKGRPRKQTTTDDVRADTLDVVRSRLDAAGVTIPEQWQNNEAYLRERLRLISPAIVESAERKDANSYAHEIRQEHRRGMDRVVITGTGAETIPGDIE